MKPINKRGAGFIVVIAILLMAVMIMDILTVFSMAREQTRESGSYQLTAISGELEATIREAENRTMQMAMGAQELLEDKVALTAYIYKLKKGIEEEGKGGFNIYIAGTDWNIIPGYETRTEDFIPTERSWYTGARKLGGSTNVTPPYVDVITGKICYTVSVMLADGDTVLGVDYTMDTIRSHIIQMYQNGSRYAVIVTGEGIIAGCSDDELVSRELNEALPEYAGIYALAKNKSGVVMSRIKSGLLYENLFATSTGSGWYLIVSESDWELYKDSYIQLIVTLLLSVMLFAMILVLYVSTVRSRQRAEYALSSKEAFLNGISAELKSPLRKILDSSSKDNARETEDYVAEFARIHEAGEHLSEMISQMFSYSSIVQKETDEKKKDDHGLKRHVSSRFRSLIVGVMLLVMTLSLFTNMQAAAGYGKLKLKNEVNGYEEQLSHWVMTQKSLLDMYCSIISTNPEMLDDYEGTIHFLDRITQQYPEISVVYMANPELEPSVYMNNGWRGAENWHVEERPWYIETLGSETGWSVSAPYYDDQTGLYCLTISERVYDHKTGGFLGIFGIDFYMDKLVDILGSSYSEDSYAFLVDGSGEIINHPYGTYQMSEKDITNISELPYGELRADGDSTMLFTDYDNRQRLLIANRNKDSRFTVFVVSGIWNIYGNVVVNGAVCLLAFLVCIVLVYRMLTDLMVWQEETNERMKEAADRAIAAGRAKGQFLAQMSHEIRTPINAVLGMNEMILRESDNEKILDYSANIQSAGRTLLSLINSILDFSKIEDGKMEIIDVRYDTAAMINNLVNSIQERAKDAGLEFNVNVDDMLPSVLYGDDVRISQVIMNLLTNAVKYTESGSVSLSLRTYERGESDIEIYVEVKDTGIGIKKEDMDKLYASFERIEELRNRNIEGTGLGMSIVTRLLGMMGSELKVESVYGVGSCFSFVIRQGIADSAPIGNYTEKLMESRRHSEEKKQLKLPGAKVLVVDDNDMNIKVASNFLRLYGINADTANSGAEAIKLCMGRQYDLIFLDHMMPRMDGIETLTKLKEEKLLPDTTVVIALTANAVVGAKESYLSSGFDDYLSKPIEVEALERKLVRYLSDRVEQEKIITVESTPAEEKDTAAAKEGAGGYQLIEFGPDDDRQEDDADQEDKGYQLIEFDDDDDDSAKTAADGAAVMKALKDMGISTDDGMRFCAGSEDFYIEVIGDYIGSSDARKAQIKECYENKQWKDYETYVHSLKSSSKTIGAMMLFEEAKDMEAAARAEDTGYIDENHDKLMADYEKLLTGLKKATGN